MRIPAVAAALMFLPLSLLAEELQVSQAWVRASLPGQAVASAFATMHNPLDQPLVLKEIHSKAAAVVELHSHNMVNGQMQMRRIENFTIPAGGEAVFRPGDQHIMLMGLAKPLQEGETVEIELCFDQLCSKLQLPVVSIMNEGRLPAVQKNEASHQHH